MWNIKKILLILIFLFCVWILGVSADDLRSQIVPNADTISIKGVNSSWGDWLWVIWICKIVWACMKIFLCIVIWFTKYCY